MSLRFVLAPVSLVLLLGATPAFAAPAESSASCFRPDTAPPGKSLVTVRVIKCPEAKQVSKNDVKPAAPETPRTAVD